MNTTDTTKECPDAKEFDIHEYLARQKKIAIIWSIEDVSTIRPDLSDEEAWQVLQVCEEWNDSSIGLAWDTLKDVADDLFPRIK